MQIMDQCRGNVTYLLHLLADKTIQIRDIYVLQKIHVVPFQVLIFLVIISDMWSFQLCHPIMLANVQGPLPLIVLELHLSIHLHYPKPHLSKAHARRYDNIPIQDYFKIVEKIFINGDELLFIECKVVTWRMPHHWI